MHVRSLDVVDAFNFPNLMAGGPTVPATVSFDIWWHTPTAVEQIADAANGFANTLVDVTSSIAFTTRTADFAFVSDPPDTATSIYARIGYEANGIYIPESSGTPVAATPTG